MDFFKSKRRIIVATGVLCLVILSGGLLTNALTERSAQKETKQYRTEELIKLKSPYVGNNSNVGGLIHNLPGAEWQKGFSLKTKEKPYGITIKYNFTNSGLSNEAIESMLRSNATVLFSLIENVDTITFDVSFLNQSQEYAYTRVDIQKSYSKDLWNYVKDENTLNWLFNSTSLEFYVFPEKYTATMSSIPGIRISSQYSGVADQVRYSTDAGGLLTWDRETGKITMYGQKAELPLLTPVYWSPLEGNSVKSSAQVKVEILNGHKTVAEKLLNIVSKDAIFYYVEPSPDVSIYNVYNTDQEEASKVVTQYFEAFAKADYETIRTLSTEYHNQNIVHAGDVWGMKWAKASEIKYAGDREGQLSFSVSVEMETVKTSAQYPSTRTSFFVILQKGEDGIWRVDHYTTG